MPEKSPPIAGLGPMTGGTQTPRRGLWGARTTTGGREAAMAEKRQMKLGMSMRGLGYHVAAWRHPGVPADGTLRFDHYVRNAQAAERGLFDMIFFADGIGIREKDEPKGSLSRSG